MLRAQGVARRNLRGVRGLSASARQEAMPSVGTLGAAIVVLNVGGFGFAAYQCEQDAKLDKRVAEMPVFGSVVMATKDILRTACGMHEKSRVLTGELARFPDTLESK